MKKLTLALLFTATFVSAQTATFTFGSAPNPFLSQSKCASMTSWNGIPATDPNNPYGLNMGDICLQNLGSIEVPWQLGFPNNGYLTQCSYVPGTLTDNGNGTATQTFTISNCYDGVNTVVTGTMNLFQVSRKTCSRYRCITVQEWQIIGGSGTVIN